MHGVFSKDATDVWAVGDSGLVYRSLDGGDSYAESFLGDERLRAVTHEGLTVIVVGDSGKVWRSTDNGGTWSISVPAGDVDLWDVTFADPTTVYVCGEGGTILKSSDGGASWDSQISGTTKGLYGMTFSSPTSGWVVGQDGQVQETTTGGALWSSVSVGATHDLLDAAVDGSRVWVVGTYGQAYRSTDGGSGWSAVNLRLDAMSDVFGVHLSGGTDVVLAGGGGFVRTSDDDGATWSFSQHTLQAFVSDFHAVGGSWWLATSQDEAVLRTTDAGSSWDFPSGTSVSRGWDFKFSAAVTERGNTFVLNPMNPNTIYCMMGSQVYVSRDLGETWQTQGNPEGATKTNSFYVSPKDTNVFVAAVSGNPNDRIVRSVNGGLSWTDELIAPYSEYGMPLEMDPDHPDTLYFGPENAAIQRSTDFGQTWGTYSTTTFRSPCDIVVIPESDSSVILVGDGVTSQGLSDMWRATDGSTTFLKMFEGLVNASEIPTIASTRLDNKVLIATAWSQLNARKTTDAGLTWPSIPAISGVTSTWGTDFSRDDPNCLMVGQFGSARQTYLSFDGGTSFVNFTNSGSNYAYYMRDRAQILQMQSSGLYKLSVSYGYTPGVGAQSLALSVPDGGEIWTAGQVEQITWSASEVALAIIEYRIAPSEPWIEVAQVPGYVGSYDWTVPFTPTTRGRVRIRDGWDSNPSDTSAGDFDIIVPAIAVSPDTLDFGAIEEQMASTLVLTIDNAGSAQLDITDVTLQTSDFTVGRTTFSVTDGGNDTLGVTFRPMAVTGYVDTLEITHNAGAPVRIPLQGVGTDIPALALTAPVGGEVWQYGTAQLITWTSVAVDSVTIEFNRFSGQSWTPLVGAFPADSQQFAWIIPDSATALASIRLRELGGELADSSAASFEIAVPRLQVTPGVLNLGLATIGQSVQSKVLITNVGTTTLELSSISSDDGDFTLDRSSASIPIAPGIDSVLVTFSPLAAGPDSATITFVTNGPGSPVPLLVHGEGTATVDVGRDTPLSFSLSQNRPNPFTGVTRIEYALPRRASVNLEVFDLQGKRVATLVREEQEPGRYSVDFGSGVSAVGGRLGPVRSGVYFYRLQAGPNVATRKMLLMR